MERARQSGYADGGREANLMLLALGKGFEQSQAIGWLNTVVEKAASICSRSARLIARSPLGRCPAGSGSLRNLRGDK